MGGQSFHSVTQQSQTAPWTVNPSRQSVPAYQPLWKDLPWHLEHPAWFAIGAGSLITAVLWLLMEVL